MVANNYEILPGAGIFAQIGDSDSSIHRALITIQSGMKQGTISSARDSFGKPSPRMKQDKSHTSRSNNTDRKPKRKMSRSDVYMKNVEKLMIKENGDLKEVYG